MQLGGRHRKEVSGFTRRGNHHACKACPRSPGRNSGGVLSPPKGAPGRAALASLCLDSLENGEILAFEPGILF